MCFVCILHLEAAAAVFCGLVISMDKNDTGQASDLISATVKLK